MSRTVYLLYSVCLLHAVLLSLCSGASLPWRGRREASTDVGIEVPVNHLDAGPVDSCEIPAANFCSSVDYSVPSGVASIAHIIEAEIRGIYDTNLQHGEQCAEALKQIHCAQKFPRCSEDLETVTLTSLNCAEMVSSVCPSQIVDSINAERVCELNGTAPLAGCKPITEFDYEFQHCPMDSDLYVTEWLHELMKFADNQLSVRLTTGALGDDAYEACRADYARYFCQFSGRCWNEGRRIEIANTYELCERVVTW